MRIAQKRLGGRSAKVCKRPCAEKQADADHFGRRRNQASRQQSPKEVRALAESLLRRELAFVAAPDFDSLEASAILDDLPAPPEETRAKKGERRGIAPYASGYYSSRLLTAAQEQHLFRRMNFAKFLANKLRSQIDPSRPRKAQLDELGRLIAISERDRSRVAESNLRLVVSIAKCFTDDIHVLAELVSEGNLALLRAVEKFDYFRGNRFSTYATHAIRRAVYRCVLKRKTNKDRFQDNDQVDLTVPSPQPDQGLNEEARLGKIFGRLSTLLAKLNPREEWIVRERFGLGKNPGCRTFQELGNELGVCKERVRQIQMRAIEKLKSWGGPELEGMLST